MNKGIIKKGSYLVLTFVVAAFLAGGGLLSTIPSDINIFTNETKVINLPFKDVTINVIPEKMLIPGGHSVGVRMDVKGVLIVGLEEIETESGEIVNPGLEAGLQIGDSILEIDGTKVDNAREVAAEINKIKKEVRLKVKRKDDIMDIRLTPVLSVDDNQYKIGVWVKDRTAGIGTLTFYNPTDHTFGALGHAITDPETGTVLSVAQGELLNSKVESVKQGKAGVPGEIKGIFYEADEPLGKLFLNTDYGIFGTTYQTIVNPLYQKPMSIGYQNDVKKGKAYILTTLEGNKIEKYEISIEKINKQTKPSTKSMVIKVTDERLLEKSGGIIQGMSGSPIIQNDKIIGAVTHVFVNDPQRGYGIFIEWMLQNANVE
ncbi:SpoIVB peptidase [Sinanaerobacter chloroacetimidivorans]|jgi:stage IV sporulation protein B|uniref:SpoIVB peptidase n=1 Tax=Sinanaerobacter chloroacetimidivorans TaxID=2818044 RepID=A0A8J8AZV3_9FIRM|nr:SpoIVB peptidase [Sinanaerobacter chloroacetimidivorans]MBR0596574.1 SpoIVB peptidase [Sinanaerobacter chloroacetimidivorans]